MHCLIVDVDSVGSGQDSAWRLPAKPMLAEGAVGAVDHDGVGALRHDGRVEADPTPDITVAR
jgi:hypothetical protein